MNPLKITGLAMIILMALTLVALPTTVTTTTMAEDEQPPQQAPQHRPWWARINVSFDQVLSLAYLVRNETYATFQWEISYNVTVAQKTLSRGDLFLQGAINASQTNESRAKAFALVATLLYSHAPVFSYIVLGKTIRANLGANHTVTNQTAEAALNATLKLRSLMEQAQGIAEANNITIPRAVEILKTVANGYINATIQLIQQGYYRAALRTNLKAFHRLVLAYGIVVKATIAQKLGLGLSENMAVRLGLARASVKVLERIAQHLPPAVRQKIINGIRNHQIKNITDFKHVIKNIMAAYYRRMAHASINATALIVAHVVVFAAINPMIPNHTAVATWLLENGLAWQMGMGNHIRPKFQALYSYVLNLTETVQEETNATGLQLLNLTLQQLSIEISQDTGVQVNLLKVFYVYMVIHWEFHHHH